MTSLKIKISLTIIIMDLKFVSIHYYKTDVLEEECIRFSYHFISKF